MSRFRHEYKYFIDEVQYAILLIRAQGIMDYDKHAKPLGSYRIKSLYFDDFHNTCMQENIDGTDPRSKFRIRYYNNDTHFLRLEKKSKSRGMTHKDSCMLTIGECKKIIQGEYISNDETFPKIKQQLLNELRLRQLQPKVIVSYDRVPFVYPAGNIRVTFDRNITSSGDVSHFLTGDYRERLILPSGQSILEVKWDEFLPLHIKDTLSMNSLQWSSFSKYYMCALHRL